MIKRPSLKLTVVLLAIAAAVVGIDQYVKYLARVHMGNGEVYRFLPGVLELQLHMNDGASLGMFSGNRVLLVLTSVVGSLLIGGGMLLYRNLTTGERVALSLILGGAVGNLIDRAASGFVTDMLYFPWIGKIPLLPEFVCNVADIAITFGVAAMIICLIIGYVRERREKKAAAADIGESDHE